MNTPWLVAMVDGNKKDATEHYPAVDLVVTDGQNQATQNRVSDVVKALSRAGITVFSDRPRCRLRH